MKQIFIDVREPQEYSLGHVTGAINLPPSKITTGALELSDVPKDTKLVLYCASGARSDMAAHYLRQLGFTNLVNGVSQRQVEADYGL